MTLIFDGSKIYTLDETSLGVPADALINNPELSLDIQAAIDTFNAANGQ